MLNIVNKSPLERDSLGACLRLAAPGAILLIEDAVYGAVRGTVVAARVQEALGRFRIYALKADLEARAVADRVVTLVWSEFGRRAEENGSGGTDHGAAGSAFLIGSRVAGKMVGEFPGLKAGLDKDGNLKATSDFRGVYAALLEQWLEFDAAAILPDAKRFKRPALIR